jgi:hypothetical protein
LRRRTLSFANLSEIVALARLVAGRGVVSDLHGVAAVEKLAALLAFHEDLAGLVTIRRGPTASVIRSLRHSASTRGVNVRRRNEH